MLLARQLPTTAKYMVCGDLTAHNFNLKTKFDMENNNSVNHENGNDANRLLAAALSRKEKKELLEKSQMFEQLSFKQIRALIWWDWFKPKKLNKFYEMLLIGKAARFAFEDAQRCS
jgi:hypothetical protein